MAALGKEFDQKKNRVKREAYRANYTREQKKEVLAKWKEFMKETSSNVPFFEQFENYFEWHNQSCVVTKTNWTKEDTKEVVRSNHPPLDKITFKHKKADVVASPFQQPTSEEVVVSKVIAQNNYTNQCLHVIGKQLDRMEERVEKKVTGNTSEQVSFSNTSEIVLVYKSCNLTFSYIQMATPACNPVASVGLLFSCKQMASVGPLLHFIFPHCL